MEQGLQKISIIVPVYNAEQFLCHCVRSIQEQDYPCLEIILVNDGSTDHSSKLCDQLAVADKRIRVIHTINGGAARARNLGLQQATGEFLMFVDADDSLEAGVCRLLRDKLIEEGADCCICGYREFWEKTGNTVIHTVRTDQAMSGREALLRRYETNDVIYNMVNPWGKLYRKSMWKNLYFTEGIYYEDMDLMPYLYLNCKKVLFIPKIGCTYLVREKSLSHGNDKDDRRVTDSIKIRQKHMEFYRQNGEQKLYEYMRNALLELIFTSDKNGWLPEDTKQTARTLFKKHWLEMIFSREMSLRRKASYSVYRLKLLVNR